jgi:hypothetical protein
MEAFYFKIGKELALMVVPIHIHKGILFNVKLLFILFF